MTKLARLISQEEGFGLPGVIPTTHHNPGDLRHAPHASHLPGDPNGIGIEPSNEAGWEDLERQLRLYAERGMTLQQVVEVYAPPTENNTEQYLKYVCDGLGMTPETPVSQALGVV